MLQGIMGHGLTCSTCRNNLKFGYFIDTVCNIIQTRGIIFLGKRMIPFVTSKTEKKLWENRQKYGFFLNFKDDL